jgi:DNA-directed RNA polymerase sigma subunit (sigma70/sigma32)
MPSPETDSDTPRTAADAAALRVRLEALSLTKTELTVLTARLGLDGTVLTYKEVAAKTGMMPALIRDLEHRVLSRVGL